MNLEPKTPALVPRPRLSPGVKKALLILRAHGPLMPKAFAELFFPADHPGWARRSRGDTEGLRRGSGLVIYAGCFLGKLRARGLAESTVSGQTRLTQKGWNAIGGRECSGGREC